MTYDKLCHGQECYLRFPGICNGNSTTVVPCHLRVGGVGGTGLKPPQICTLPGCLNCHNVLDGRVQTDLYTQDEIRSMTLVGLVQWLAWQWKREILICGGIAA
jgi:hypothetical protein